MCSVVSPFTLCGLTKSTAVGTVLDVTLTWSMLETGPAASQVLFSPGHWRRVAGVRSQDCSNCVLEPTVGAMGAPQTLAWPTSHVYMPTKPTAAKARPFSPAGALFALWNILQVLNLGSQQQRCNSSL